MGSLAASLINAQLAEAVSVVDGHVLVRLQLCHAVFRFR